MNPNAEQKSVLKPIRIHPDEPLVARPPRSGVDERTPRRPATLKRGYWPAMMVLSLAIVVFGVGAVSSMHGDSRAPAFVVSVAQASTSDASAIEVSRPSHLTSGNLLIAQLAVVDSGDVDVAASKDWFQVRKDASGRNQFSQSIWYHVASADEPSSYRFTFDRPTSASIGMINVTGIQPQLPVDAEIGLGSVGVSVTIPSATTLQDADLLLAFASANNGSPHWRVPYGMDLIPGTGRTQGPFSIVAAQQYVPDATNTDTRTFLSDFRTPHDMVGQVVAIRVAVPVSTATETTTGQVQIVAPTSKLPSLSVNGNALIGSDGQTVQLHGVNRSGTESGCVQGWGIFDGPVDAVSIAAMRSWKINVVRIPLNEDCWLGINGVKAGYAGETYQRAVIDYVTRLNAAGIYTILELHWSAPGSERATKQRPMPDRDHSIAFWSSVASAFANDSGAIFDLFNEPFPSGTDDTPSAWTCWNSGGDCDGIPYVTAGMQELVNAVRSTGAPNLIMLGGTSYSHDLSGWIRNRPYDPSGNLAASWHLYNFNPCVTTECWDENLSVLTSQVPLIAGEIGEDDCSADFVTTAMAWLDAHGQSYLAWTWDAWGPSCESMSLIQNDKGIPEGRYGQGVHDYLTKHW
ncbi:MAG: glycoside hydrolase family 5 protein [Nitrolancea sp.]